MAAADVRGVTVDTVPPAQSTSAGWSLHQQRALFIRVGDGGSGDVGIERDPQGTRRSLAQRLGQFLGPRARVRIDDARPGLFGDQLLEQKCAATTGGALHAARGGSYGFDPDDSRSSSRRGFAATDHRPNIGFRVLCRDKP